ncbi:MAG: MarR family winged helix-turn-helix transcriptional regulator [Acidimicrobiales bacterium]
MSEPRWLNPLEARAWRGLLTMQGRLLRRVARDLQRETGLSAADYEVLVNLSEAPSGRARSFELGSATQWEKSRLSHHLTRMAQRGLVVRESCPTDSRGSFIALTDAGRAAIDAAAPRHVEHVRRWFIDALTADQLTALAEISDVVLAELDDDGEDGCSAGL